MEIRLINKKCPNCGANLKFGFEDKSVTCEYCNTHVLIEHQRQNMYKPAEDPNAKRIYVNKATEILKWVSRILISVFLVIFGFAIMSFSGPIYGVLLIIAGVLTLLPISMKIFFGQVYVKIAMITVLAVFGFFAGSVNSYDLPKEFQGKYVSDTTSLTVEIKNNKIIVNDNGEITKEKIYTWDETYGSIVYHNIKVDNGKYNFRIVENPSKGYQFYQRPGDYGKPIHYFYNIKNKTDEYVCGEFSY